MEDNELEKKDATKVKAKKEMDYYDLREKVINAFYENNKDYPTNLFYPILVKADIDRKFLLKVEDNKKDIIKTEDNENNLIKAEDNQKDIVKTENNNQIYDMFLYCNITRDKSGAITELIQINEACFYQVSNNEIKFDVPIRCGEQISLRVSKNYKPTLYSVPIKMAPL